MKVHILYDYSDYYGPNIKAIYATKDLADKALGRIEKENRYYFKVEEVDVIDE